MKLAFILGAAIGVCGVSCAEDPSSVVFSAIVQEVVMLSNYSGPARVVHFDPRYVLKVEIESASADAPELVVGETAVFAIHSPAQLFAPVADPTGRTFTFSVVREMVDGKPKFSLLQVERQADAQPSTSEPTRLSRSPPEA